MNIRRIATGLALALTCHISSAAERPNLIVIMCDDLGYADVGFNGCKDIPTPNIDSIAKNGVRFTSGYTSYSVCGPSRAGFMTGRYEQRFGFERNPQYRPRDPNMGLPLSEATIASALKQVGYKSGIIGKWHQGAHPSLHPLKRGFDEFFGHLGGGHRYFPEELTIKDSYSAKDENQSYRTWIMRNNKPVEIKKYLTDEFSDEAVQFVTRHKDNPFFLYLAYNAPHGPLQATDNYLARFTSIKDKKRKTYAAMVSAVDDGVGRLLARVRKLGIEEKTLIFFLSDNGGPETKNGSNNGVLRGGKGSAYEGGYRVPYALQWKGRISPGVYGHPVSSLDIFGTIAGLSGAPIDPKKPLDGVNLIPFVTGKNNGVPHKAIYLRKFDGGQYAVRQGDYKLLIPSKKGKPQLYNLAEDIGETKNLAAAHPERLAELDKVRKAWVSELIDPIFLGLIHTPAWQKKMKRRKKKKK